MRSWLRRLRGALGLGLSWGAFGFAVGGAIELVHNIWPNPLGSTFDIWPAVLAFPGFLGGVAFSTVLGIAGRRHRFVDLSMPKFAAWGAVGGLAVGLIPAVMVALGWATATVPVWQIILGAAGPCALGGSVAASGSLALARLAEDPILVAQREQIAEMGLSDEESRELLGEG